MCVSVTSERKVKPMVKREPPARPHIIIANQTIMMLTCPVLQVFRPLLEHASLALAVNSKGIVIIKT